MDSKKKFGTIEIFSGIFCQAENVKNLLENEGIHSCLSNEILGSMAPWLTGIPGPGSVSVIISTEDYDKALLIVKSYEKSALE